MRLDRRIVFLLSLVAVAGPAGAERFPEAQVPRSLKDWIAWALDGAEDRLCPSVNGTLSCLWPGRLQVTVDGNGGSFALGIQADRALEVPLPGGDRRWPQEVRVDGAPAPVLEAEGAPAVRVRAGSHRIEGRFAWDRIPDSLPVPKAIALVELTIEGRDVPSPRREEEGLLILRQGGGGTTEAESLTLKVSRRIEDGIPLGIQTRLALEVSGKAREVTVTGALLPGTAPLAVSGDLPARLEPDGKLRVQVRAGTFAVWVLARATGRPDRLPRAPAAPPWPAEEVWVFAANERLRLVEVSGAPPIDPSRTELPQEWRVLPAFLLEGEGALLLKEARRGEPAAPPDRLDLTRHIWLDQSGRGFTIRDRFTGLLGRSTRLDLTAPGELGRVEAGGRAELITLDPQSQTAGVELRTAPVAVTADSRLPRRLALGAVGWNVGVQSLRADLMLPPGWRLLAAPGVDRAPGSWAGSWNLLAFFLVLLVAVAAQKLLGGRWGAIALVTLVLLHREAAAPRLLWLSLLAAMAVLGVAPEGIVKKLVRAVWWGSAVGLALTLVGFAVEQIRTGLYPQVAAEVSPSATLDMLQFERRAAAPPPPTVPKVPAPAAVPEGDLAEPADVEQEVASPVQAPAARRPVARKAEAKRESLAGYAFTYSRSQADQQDPHAVIQTGAGIPNWSWRSYSLAWSGPVAKEHRVRLLLLSPGANLVLALLRVILATALALRLFAGVLPALRERLRRVRGLGAVFSVVLALVAVPARAQEETPPGPTGGLWPSPELLEQLRDRLTRAPDCAPHCVATARLHLTVEGGTLRLAAEVHAGAATGWAIPGPATSWVPRSVAVDGQDASGRLARFADGFLRVRVAAGVHQIALSGPLPARDSLTLQLGERPRRATASAPGWQVDGIREDGSADASVQLSRRLGAGVAAAGGGGIYEPWLEVTRVLDLGVAWGVDTVVRRVSPPGAPVVVKVPLLKGMLVTDASLQVKGGEVLATLGRDETEVRWSATLPPVEGEEVTLRASEGKPWSEVWLVNCGIVWQCEASGLPPVARYQDGRLAPEFRPWPGETLKLRLRRPKGAAGSTMTIDRASLQVAPGARLEDATLDLTARASRTGPLTVTLPDGAEVQELKVGGKDRPVRPDGNKLTLTIDAGDQAVRVVWRRPGGMRFLHRAPAVALSEPAVNATVSLPLPEGRWVLLTGGPAWGPAVLAWGYLIVVLLVAFTLSRLPQSPLGVGAWTLLGLGLSQLPAAGAAVVAGWFLALAWRRDRDLGTAVRHDLIQLLLAFWTLLALGFLYAAIHGGLLFRPDMLVTGGGSTGTLLQWYQDRVPGPLPRPWVLSLPLWTYRVSMLLWSLWLASRLVRWLPWAWASFSSGALWKAPAKRPAASPPEEPKA